VLLKHLDHDLLGNLLVLIHDENSIMNGESNDLLIVTEN